MKNYINYGLTIICIGCCLFFNSCEEIEIDEQAVNELAQALGWLESSENLNEVESALFIGQSTGSATATQVDLSNKFPPIGDQGQYGTCVAWTVGYNLKTALEAMDKGLSTNALSNPSNQFSPKYLFNAIPSNYKASDCNGTIFEAAFDVMQSKGIATEASVPYTNLGGCNASTAAWDAEAANYKIQNYRKIDTDANTVKSYLEQGRPVAVGIRVGDNFLRWNSNGVLTSDTYDYSGMHAYHAAVVSGYDDNRGPNGAFRLVNSWSDFWGDDGYIWVDYFYFQTDFCFAAFVATNQQSNFNPDNDNDNQVDEEDIIAGNADLIAWALEDYDDTFSTNPRKRNIGYNVYNIGDQTVPSSADWNIVYLYYNAYDANEWDILLYDYYTNDFNNSVNNGELSDGPGLSGNWWNNVDIAGGSSVADAFGGENFYWSYTLPQNLNGYYYLVLIADGYDVVAERDESNNYFFFTSFNDEPIWIQNGIMDDPNGKTEAVGGSHLQKPAPTPSSLAPKPTTIGEKTRNAYSPQEIKGMIEHHKNSGQLQAKIERLKNTQQNTKVVE